MEWLVAWIVLAIVGAIVASNKGRSGAGWFFLCLLLTPLMILVLLALPTRKSLQPQPPAAEAMVAPMPPLLIFHQRELVAANVNRHRRGHRARLRRDRSVARIGAITRDVLRCAAATGATPLRVADGIVGAQIRRSS